MQIHALSFPFSSCAPPPSGRVSDARLPRRRRGSQERAFWPWLRTRLAGLPGLHGRGVRPQAVQEVASGSLGLRALRGRGGIVLRNQVLWVAVSSWVFSCGGLGRRGVPVLW